VVHVVNAADGSPNCDAEVTATHPPNGMETFLRGNDCVYRGAVAAGDYTLDVSAVGYADAQLSAHVASAGGVCPALVTSALTVSLTR